MNRFETTAITSRFGLCNQGANSEKTSVHVIPCGIWLRLHAAMVVEAHRCFMMKDAVLPKHASGDILLHAA